MNYSSKIVSSGTSWSIVSGDVADYTSVYGTFLVSSGATDEFTRISSGGLQETYAGGVTVSATVYDGGTLHVNPGATVSRTYVRGGQLIADDNGVADTVTASGGNINVFSGGSVKNAVLTSSAVMTVSSGADVSSALLLTGAMLNVLNGGTIRSMELKSGTAALVQGAAEAVTVSTGAVLNGFTQSGTAPGSIEAMSSSALAGTVKNLNGEGYLNFASGANAVGTILSSGSLSFANGARASATTVSGGVMNLANGAYASAAAIHAGAVLNLGKTASANGVTVYMGGQVQQFVQNGASAFIGSISGNAVNGSADGLNYSGIVSAVSGASLTSVTQGDGTLFLRTGASASGLTVLSGGVLVYGGADVRNAVLNGGAMELAANGTAEDVMLFSGASFNGFTHTGSTAAGIASANGSMVYGASNVVVSGVMSAGAGVYSELTAAAEGGIVFTDGAEAQGVSVLTGGTLDVRSGAALASVMLVSGAALNVKDGASVQGITQGGGLVNVTVTAENTAVVSGTNSYGQFSLSGNLADGFAINKGGILTVSAGASATNLNIQAGGLLSASIAGYVSGYSAEMGKYFLISSGAMTGLNTLAGIELQIESGYSVTSQTVRENGVQRILSGGTAIMTTVSSGGTLAFESAASATDVAVKSGGLLRLDVYGAAEALLTGSDEKYGSFTLSGGSASGFVLSSGGMIDLHRGAAAHTIRVLEGGMAVISSGATGEYVNVSSGGAIGAYVYDADSVTSAGGSNAIGTYQLSNGTASSFYLENGGFLNVYSAGKAQNTMVDSDGLLHVENAGIASSTTVLSGGVFTAEDYSVVKDLTIASGGQFTAGSHVTFGGTITCAGSFKADSSLNTADASFVFNLSDRSEEDDFMVSNLAALSSASSFSIVVGTSQTGSYKLAEGAYGFLETLTVKNTFGTVLGAFTSSSRSFSAYGLYYTLTGSENDFSVSISEVPQSGSVRTNLLSNGCSQIVAFGTKYNAGVAEKSVVGYIANAGTAAPAWIGTWEWSGTDMSMWDVVGAGHFQGSEVDYDGLLLYNGYGNTFAAWTDLNEGSYGYVSLCHVDGNFATKCLADFDSNGYDDVIIYDENGSVGIVSDAAAYHDVWHVESGDANVWSLEGAGRFNPEADSIVFRNTANNHVYLWDNQDPTYETWNWTQTDAGYLEDGWSIAAIGDFQGDGLDDIVVWQESTGYMFAWEDGKSSNQRWIGQLDPADWEVAGVGDYNGDGKEDLLLREMNTGWGGLGYWASANADNWTDMNARVENNAVTDLKIIAG